MPLSFAIAWRFLFKARKSAAQVIFSAISVLSIAFSVMLFMLIHVVLYGFSGHLEESLLGFEAPLALTVPLGAEAAVQTTVEAFAALHPEFGIKILAEREFDGLIRVLDDPPQGVRVRTVGHTIPGIESGRLKVYFQEDTIAGPFQRNSSAVLIGEKLYERLRFLPGSAEIVTLTNPFAELGPAGELEPAVAEFTVAGIVASGFLEFDSTAVLIGEAGFKKVADAALFRPTLLLYPKEGSDVDEIKRAWEESGVGTGAVLKTWKEKNDNRFRALAVEKVTFFTLFALVMLVSCFNLAGVIVLFGVAKAREAAIFLTLGLSQGAVRTVYVGIGLILGGLGALIGVTLALALVGLKDFLVDPASATLFAEMPLKVEPLLPLVLAIATPLLAAAIAFVPADRLARLKIAEGLRLT